MNPQSCSKAAVLCQLMISTQITQARADGAALRAMSLLLPWSRCSAGWKAAFIKDMGQSLWKIKKLKSWINKNLEIPLFKLWLETLVSETAIKHESVFSKAGDSLSREVLFSKESKHIWESNSCELYINPKLQSLSENGISLCLKSLPLILFGNLMTWWQIMCFILFLLNIAVLPAEHL